MHQPHLIPSALSRGIILTCLCISLLVIFGQAVWSTPKPSGGNQSDNSQTNNLSADSTTVTPPDVTIDLAVRVGILLSKQRSLAVREGGNGWDILNRAVQEGFIHSYETYFTPRGYQVRCIDDICGQTVAVCGFQGYLGWGFYENGASAPSGLHAIRADDGDRFDLGFPQLDARLLRC